MEHQRDQRENGKYGAEGDITKPDHSEQAVLVFPKADTCDNIVHFLFNNFTNAIIVVM